MGRGLTMAHCSPYLPPPSLLLRELHVRTAVLVEFLFIDRNPIFVKFPAHKLEREELEKSVEEGFV